MQKIIKPYINVRRAVLGDPNCLTTIIIFLFCPVLAISILCYLVAKEARVSGAEIKAIMGFITLFLAIPFAAQALRVLWIFKAYKPVSWEISDDEVKYINGFLGVYTATIRCSRIVTVRTYQGILQKKDEVGNVTIFTSAEDGYRSMNFYDIKEWREVYDFFLKKMEENNQKKPPN
jgi:membrane protein YdbS with pleckstrin-like domain